MKRIIIPIVALATISGCCPRLYPQKTESTEHTVTITETIRDTIIQVQPDSSIVQALIRCDSTGRARLEEIRTLKESARIQQHISLMELDYDPLADGSYSSGLCHNGPASILTIIAKVDSLGIYLQYKERYKNEQQIQTIETVIEKEINVLKWWQKALMWTGAGAVSVFLLFLIARIFKRQY